MTGFGERAFDLSTARTNERVRVRGAKVIGVTKVDAAATIRIGEDADQAFDLRDYAAFPVAGEEAVYLSNAAAGAGDELVLVVSRTASIPEPIGRVREVSEVTGTIDVSSRSGRDLGKARVMDDGGALITDTNRFPVDSEVTSADGAVTDSTTATSTNVQVSHAEGPVQVVAAVTGAATLTVDVSHNGGTTWTPSTYDLTGGDDEGVVTIHGFPDVRARVNQNLTRLSIAAKGVGG